MIDNNSLSLRVAGPLGASFEWLLNSALAGGELGQYIVQHTAQRVATLQLDPLIKGSRVEIQSLQSVAGRGIEGCVGSVLGKAKDCIAVRLDGEKKRIVKVKRSNLMIIDYLPRIREVLSGGAARGPYIAYPQDYDIDDGIEQSLRQSAEEAAESNALVMEKLRNSPEATSIAGKSLRIIIMEYSRPSEWYEKALRELGARKLPSGSGANWVLDPEVFDIVVEDLDGREEEFGVNLKKLENRFVITEAHKHTCQAEGRDRQERRHRSRSQSEETWKCKMEKPRKPGVFGCNYPFVFTFGRRRAPRSRFL